MDRNFSNYSCLWDNCSLNLQHNWNKLLRLSQSGYLPDKWIPFQSIRLRQLKNMILLTKPIKLILMKCAIPKTKQYCALGWRKFKFAVSHRQQQPTAINLVFVNSKFKFSLWRRQVILRANWKTLVWRKLFPKANGGTSSKDRANFRYTISANFFH